MVPEMLAMPLAKLIQPGAEPGASVKIDIDDSSLELVLVARLRQDENLIRLNLVNACADIAKLDRKSVV
jgi:hypothetical protein